VLSLDERPYVGKVKAERAGRKGTESFEGEIRKCLQMTYIGREKRAT